MADEQTEAGALAIPDGKLLDPLNWRTRTHGAFAVLRSRMDAELAELRRARKEAIGDGQLRQSDVAPLVQTLVGTTEELRTIAHGFGQLASGLEAAVQEEVAEVVADHNYGRITIGDDGTEIVAGWNRAGGTDIDHRNVDEALTALYRKKLEEGGEDPAVVAELGDAYRQAFTDARTYGKVEYLTTKLTALVRALQGTGDSDIAGLLESCMVKVKRDPRFSITREEPKARR